MMQVFLRGMEKQKSWYLDNGCSQGMTGEKSMFQTLAKKEGADMGFGVNQKGKVIGMGTIGNSSISINNVWFVDGLRHNLLSISQFCDSGYEVMFDKSNCIIIHNTDKSIVIKVKRKTMLTKSFF